MNLRSGKVVGVTSYKNDDMECTEGSDDDDDDNDMKCTVVVTTTSRDRLNPEVWNIHTSDGQWDDDWWNKCPICGEQCGSNRMHLKDRAASCKNRHHWHFHYSYVTGEYTKVYHDDGRKKYQCSYRGDDEYSSCNCRAW